jgi:hypothetical protein
VPKASANFASGMFSKLYLLRIVGKGSVKGWWRSRGQHNIKIDLTDIGYEHINLIELWDLRFSRLWRVLSLAIWSRAVCVVGISISEEPPVFIFKAESTSTRRHISIDSNYVEFAVSGIQWKAFVTTEMNLQISEFLPTGDSVSWS